MFIRGFSSIANPLIVFLKKGPQRLKLNSADDQALPCLKWAFTMLPILKHPDPSKPFIVEQDASERRVGAILSQRFGEKPKLQPVVYFPENSLPLNEIGK